MPKYQEIFVTTGKSRKTHYIEVPDNLSAGDMGEVTTIAEWAILKGIQDEKFSGDGANINCGGLLSKAVYDEMFPKKGKKAPTTDDTANQGGDNADAGTGATA